MSPTVKPVTLRDGRTRYRIVVDEGRGATGGRRQKTYTFDTENEARAHLATHQRPGSSWVELLCPDCWRRLTDDP